ncbi:GIY-YIG nuclease family protein [Streptomyces pristinaespiralis]|uniref:GIY-YIG nuclease family protein n=1 Tax=Streptomyces pristinaespiralis TaxID=38300 RepID=UPI00378FAC44
MADIGAFGESVVNIGLTRRLDRMDRVNELGDAAVPFRFDVHALIFSDDAVSLERVLHQDFECRRVNWVNARREFFHTTPAEVHDALARHAGQHPLESHEEPDVPEWRASTRAS